MSIRSLFAILFVVISFGAIQAQHCTEAMANANGEESKIRAGGGFKGSYSLSCIQQGSFTEIAVSFQVFNTIPKGNSDDKVFAMRIDEIKNLPDGMCWVSSSATNSFGAGTGGTLYFRGTTHDQAGQYTLAVTMSFDTDGDGTFDRTAVNYNKVSNTGKMILRVSNETTPCENIDYSLPGNTAAVATSSIEKQ
jgi:hypothetical protein